MKKCTVPNCQNPATHFDPIDKDFVCQVHLDFLRGCGIHTEYRKIEIVKERLADNINFVPLEK